MRQSAEQFVAIDLKAAQADADDLNAALAARALITARPLPMEEKMWTSTILSAPDPDCTSSWDWFPSCSYKKCIAPDRGCSHAATSIFDLKR